LQYSDAVKADLILVMTHTEKGIRELIIGTLTQQIVNKSEEIPVMCIYPHATGYTFDFMG
jgi:nucleotide-binding universal stress UspA family protein